MADAEAAVHKEELIKKFFEHGILVHEGLLEKGVSPTLLDKVTSEKDMLVLNEDYAEVLLKGVAEINWYETDHYRVHAEREQDHGLYQAHLQYLQRTTLSASFSRESSKHTGHISSLEVALDLAQDGAPAPLAASYALETGSGNGEVGEVGNDHEIKTSGLDLISAAAGAPEIISLSYANQPRKFTVEDFNSLFVSRYVFLQGLLRTREELQNTLPISRILSRKEKGTTSIIGMVSSTMSTKSGNVILIAEDTSGEIKVILNLAKNAEARDIVPDEVVGITGTFSNGVLFADSIVWPDIPQYEIKKNLSAPEEYAIFLSDLHVGSTLFLHEEFQRFLAWISGKAGNSQQRNIASKVKYVFIAGDAVDGVGVYPGQETELSITDIAAQYDELARLLSGIPSDKKIIMCPGNHDIAHIAEPQPQFYKEYASALYTLPNVIIVSNPAYLTVGKTDTFPGYDILLYHGFSFDYYVATVDSIRNNGGYHRADLIMKFLLKRRHLAPSFKSTPYFPMQGNDSLLIKKIPDFFVTGHIHYSNIGQYKSVTTISCSCWQGKTTFQEKLGHDPEPARVPIVNLQNREMKVLRF